MAEVILLTSSPRVAGFDVRAMSSSPLLPCPKTMIRKQTQLRTGIATAPIPQNASAAFTSAAIHESANNRTIRDTDAPRAVLEETEVGEISVKAKVARKPRMAEAKAECEDLVVKRPRKPRAKKAVVACEDGKFPKEGLEPKEKAGRKPRAKKTDADGQTKMPKGKVTKASTARDKSTDGNNATKGKDSISRSNSATYLSVIKKKKSEVVSGHSTPGTGQNTDAFDISFGDDLRLPEASKRKLNWTPPRATGERGENYSTSFGDEVRTVTTDSDDIRAGLDLLGSFGHNNIHETLVPVRTGGGGGTRKRKLIELVKTNKLAVVNPELTVKVKAPKKKPRTITDLAMSAYRASGEEGATTPAPASLLQYFSFKNGEAAMESRTLEGFKIPAKPRPKSPVKSSTKASKSKQPDIPKLLSPHSALKQVEKQNFVFGTSSQLAREDSPTLLRDLHQAIVASNKVDGDLFIQPLSSPVQETLKSCFVGGNGKVLFPGKRNLWSAGSHGDFMDVEMVDMTETPKPPKLKVAQASAASNFKQQGPLDTHSGKDTEWIRLDETPGGLRKVIERSSNTPVSAKDIDISIPTLVIIRPANSDVEPMFEKATSPKKTKPDFGSYPTAKLAQDVASYRFKPVKNRDTMIALLEKCWEAQQRPVLGALVANRALSTSPVKFKAKQRKGNSECVSTRKGKPGKPSGFIESPKRPVGRPRKNSSTTILPEAIPSKVEEDNRGVLSDSDVSLSARRTPRKSPAQLSSAIDVISDSDTPLTPSPPRRRASKVGTPLKALDLVSEDSFILNPTSRQLQLHKHITRAITNMPPSTDSKNPNWHEKILLYDPIVLEDLTLWLNTGALQKVGWDGEVELKEVKAWCLAKSVCCLWRENLRGGARSRY